MVALSVSSENLFCDVQGLAYREPQNKRVHDQYYEIAASQSSMQKRSRGSFDYGRDVKVLGSYNKQGGYAAKVVPDVQHPSTPPQESEHSFASNRFLSSGAQLDDGCPFSVASLSSQGYRVFPSIEEAFCDVPQLDQEYLRACLDNECRLYVNHNYLNQVQVEVDAHKRLVLVDWMVEVVDEFNLGQETLFLAVSLLDRFMSCQPVSRAILQLLGVTCLWVASKYEEVAPPVLADFVDITDNSYRAEDLICMEGSLLKVLNYKLTVPTSIHFLHQFLHQYHKQTGALQGSCSPPGSPSQHGQPTKQGARRVAHLAEYLLELSLLTPDVLRYRPSLVAATALFMAVRMLEQADLRTLCQAVTGPGADADVMSCIRELASMHDWACQVSKAPAVADKYGHRARSCVSKLPAYVMLDHFFEH